MSKNGKLFSRAKQTENGSETGAAAEQPREAADGKSAGKRDKKKTGLPLKERLGLGQARWKHMRRRDRLILLLPAVAAVIAVAAVLMVNRDAKQMELEGKPCQYYAGNIYRIQPGSVLRRTAEEETLLESGKSSQSMTPLPIYDEDKQQIILPENMIYFAPRTDKMGRVDYFTALEFRESGVSAIRDRKELALSPGFLYDGADLYLFLEPMTLSFNGYVLELPAMSYVEAVYHGDVMVFNYGAGEFLMESPKGEVTAQAVGGDYTVSLVGDSLTSHDGERSLLFTKPELLDPVS